MTTVKVCRAPSSPSREEDDDQQQSSQKAVCKMAIIDCSTPASPRDEHQDTEKQEAAEFFEVAKGTVNQSFKDLTRITQKKTPEESAREIVEQAQKSVYSQQQPL